MFHSDKKAIASDAADNVEVHPLKDEAGDGDAEGSIFHQSELLTNSERKSPPNRNSHQSELLTAFFCPIRFFDQSDLSTNQN